MKAKRTAPRNVDEYIAGFPPDVREKLRKIRLTIRKAAPAAEETISYRMPTFKLKGNLVHFAAFRDHISFFPTPTGIDKFRKALSGFELSRGTIRLPLDKPLPLDLIGRVVKFRVGENLARAAAKGR